MSNPFEDFKKSFWKQKPSPIDREFLELFGKVVEKRGIDKVKYGVDMINALWDYFVPKYGEERAVQIIEKVAIPPPVGWNLDKLIHVGERWHVINLYFNQKISPDEFKEKLSEVDLLPH